MTQEQEYSEIQNSLKSKLEIYDQFDKFGISTIGGVDLAYWNKAEKEYAVCCIVVIDFKTHKIIEKKHFSGEIKTPYITGFLAFRELPLVLKTAELLTNIPDIYICLTETGISTQDIWELLLMRLFI